MNEKVKNLWVEALESGTYKQAQAALKIVSIEGSQYDEYCCLGVLTELFIKEHPGIISCKKLYPINKKGYNVLGYSYKNDETKSMSNTDSVLPKPVMRWAELSEADPVVSHGNAPINLSTLNDNGHDFKEIASIIRNQL